MLKLLAGTVLALAFACSVLTGQPPTTYTTTGVIERIDPDGKHLTIIPDANPKLRLNLKLFRDVKLLVPPGDTAAKIADFQAGDPVRFNYHLKQSLLMAMRLTPPGGVTLNQYRAKQLDDINQKLKERAAEAKRKQAEQEVEAKRKADEAKAKQAESKKAEQPARTTAKPPFDPGQGKDARFALEKWADVNVGGKKVPVYGQPFFDNPREGGLQFSQWQLEKDVLTALVEVTGVRYNGSTVWLTTHDKDSVQIDKIGLPLFNRVNGEKLRIRERLKDLPSIKTIAVWKNP